jgi:hypothetical protein
MNGDSSAGLDVSAQFQVKAPHLSEITAAVFTAAAVLGTAGACCCGGRCAGTRESSPSRVCAGAFADRPAFSRRRLPSKGETTAGTSRTSSMQVPVAPSDLGGITPDGCAVRVQHR